MITVNKLLLFIIINEISIIFISWVINDWNHLSLFIGILISILVTGDGISWVLSIFKLRLNNMILLCKWIVSHSSCLCILTIIYLTCTSEWRLIRLLILLLLRNIVCKISMITACSDLSHLLSIWSNVVLDSSFVLV